MEPNYTRYNDAISCFAICFIIRLNQKGISTG